MITQKSVPLLVNLTLTLSLFSRGPATPRATGSPWKLATATLCWWTGSSPTSSPSTGTGLVLHSLGAVFWTQADFVGKRSVVIGDMLEFSHLPRGKYLILPVGPVGQDLVTHYLCPCGAYLAPGSKQ